MCFGCRGNIILLLRGLFQPCFSAQPHRSLQLFSAGHACLTEVLPPPARVLLPGIRTNLLVLRGGGGLEVKERRHELHLGQLCALAGWWRCLASTSGRWLFRILQMFIEFTVFRTQNAPDCCAASESKHQTPVCNFYKASKFWKCHENRSEVNTAPALKSRLVSLKTPPPPFSLFLDARCRNIRAHRGKSFRFNYLWQSSKRQECASTSSCSSRLQERTGTLPSVIAKWQLVDGWRRLLLNDGGVNLDG